VAGTKREKDLARQRAERQAARDTAARRRRRQRNAVLGSAVAVALVAGAALAGGTLVGGSDEPSDSVAATVETSAAPTASATAGTGAQACTYEATGEQAAREAPVPPTDGVATTGVSTVTMATDRGDIVFEMDNATAPCTANSLRSLAAAGYFDGTACHRLTTRGIEVLQCGDPTGTGSGGPGYQFADEALEGATYPRGTVAMANAGPGTNGSQFFLVYGDSTLPPNYTPFGTITSGLEVLDAVAKAGSDDSNGAGDGKPKLPITITTLRAAEVS
jgi:peptidyl-prolyl cis-trans isomerase B (cyclophilin B)